MKKYFNRKALFFIIPSFIGVSIFILIPFIDVIIRSFQNEVLRSFVGLDNYKEIFTNDAFKLAAEQSGQSLCYNGDICGFEDSISFN